MNDVAIDSGSTLDIKTVFNAGVACHAIALADQLGLFERLEAEGSLPRDLVPFARDSPLAVEDMLRLLEMTGVIREAPDGAIGQGPRFAECLARKSLFTWLFHASSSVLVHAADMVRDPQAAVPERDGALIGATMGDLGRRNIDQVLLNIVDWRQYACIMDVGCGDASRLQSLVRAHGVDGLGLELSAPALNAARARIARSPEAGRLKLVHGDARFMAFEEDLRRKVDVAYMALLAHDLLPIPNAIRILSTWKEQLPNLRTLIICEAVRAGKPYGLRDVDTPSIGYEYLHSLSRQVIESDANWRLIIEEAGWTLERTQSVAIPSNTIIYVCSR